MAPSRTDSRPAARYLAMLGLDGEVPIEGVLGTLIQVVLAKGPATGMTLDEISRGIGDITGLSFGREEIGACARNNDALGLSLSTHEMPYGLITASARSDTLDRIDRALLTEANVVREWAVQVRNTSSLEIETAWLEEDFPRFFSEVALYHGVESVALAYGEKDDTKAFLSQLDSEPWNGIPERLPGYRDFCREVFPGFFLEASGPRAAFVVSSLDRVFELCRLNLSPTASRLAIKQLSGLTAYLDTNVLFRLFGFQGPAAHLDIRRVLGVGARVGAVFRVSPRTVDEFRNAATKKVRAQELFFAPLEALVKVDPNLPDKAYLIEFHKIVRGRQVQLPDLLASLAKLERTLELFNIRVWNEKTDEVSRAKADVDVISRDLMQQYEEHEARKDPQQRRAISWEMAEHDAHNLVLVEKLRPRTAKGFCDAKVWFLTFHHVLARFAHRRADKSAKPSTVAMFEHWTQLIRSVLPRSEDFDQTFVRNLRTPILHGHGANYHSAMSKIAGRLATYGALSDDHFASIMVDSTFGTRVARVMSDNPRIADKDLAALVDERVAQEASREREGRLRADQRLSESIRRSEEASAEAATALEELWSAKKQVTEVRDAYSGVSKELIEAQKAAETLRGEKAALAHEAGAYRTKVHRNVRLGVAALIAGALVVLWSVGIEEATIKGTEINAVAASILGVAVVGALVSWSQKAVRAAFIAGAGLVLAVLSVGTWKRSKGELGPSETVSSTRSSKDSGRQ